MYLKFSIFPIIYFLLKFMVIFIFSSLLKHIPIFEMIFVILKVSRNNKKFQKNNKESINFSKNFFFNECFKIFFCSLIFKKFSFNEFFKKICFLIFQKKTCFSDFFQSIFQITFVFCFSIEIFLFFF